MLREALKQEIDSLSDSQVRKMADFVASMRSQAPASGKTLLFWQRATSSERAEDFRAWIAQLSATGLSLPNEAFDRGNIYE